MNQDTLHKLREIVGQDQVTTVPEELACYAYDGTGQEFPPGAVAFPGSAEEICRIMALASATPFPVVPRGAGTGMTGGALPVAGGLVLAVSLFFTGLSLTIHSALIIFGFAVLTAIVFALAGLVNGIYAKTIDGINIVPTFVLTPLVYLGGIFYSVHVLPEWWQTITYSNPLFYLVNGFRYGFLGITDVALSISLLVLVAMTVVLIAINWYFIKTGLGLRQ